MIKKSNKIKKIHLKKGDKAYIISGKDKGKVGEVLRVLPKLGIIVVDGVNIKTKHIKPTQNSKGEITTKPHGIDSSKAMFYSEKHEKPSRLGKKILEDGKKVRFLKKFNEVV